MSDNFLEHFRNCSKNSKQAVGNFVDKLLKSFDKSKQSQQQSQISQQSYKLQQLFIKITSTFTLEKSREISKNQRFKRQLDSNQYNYGQITFKTISILLLKINKYRVLSNKQIFYDLGSGSGKVLFAASLNHPFQKCIGIQVLKSLHQYSLQLKHIIQQNINLIEQTLPSNRILKYRFPQIQMVHKDFKDYDWSNGTVVFVSSTCYNDEVMREVAILSEKLSKDSIFVTLSKRLEKQEKCWKLLGTMKGQTSWGQTTIYIQIKKE